MESGGDTSDGRAAALVSAITPYPRQLWGPAGERQVRDAWVSAVANGGLGFGALLLKRAQANFKDRIVSDGDRVRSTSQEDGT